MSTGDARKREYYIRGKKVVIEEISGILAVKPQAELRSLRREVEKRFGREATKDFDLSSEELEGFSRAGWFFVHPTAKVARAAEAREVPEGASFVGRVFRHPDRHIMIGTDRLTVKIKPEMSESEVKSALTNANLEVVRQLKFAPNLYEVRVSANRDPLDVAVELHQNPTFIYAEPQMIRYLPQRYTPSDPNYDQQWQWNNGGSGGCTAGADIDAEDAWDITRGAGVRVAVIDNGIEVTHTDLSPAIVGGGYFEDDGAGGVNFVVGTTGFPNGNHGTFCAGIAVARADNGVCGCGAANSAGFIPIACLGDQLGTQATLARAVAYAADPTSEDPGADPADGADVISCSLGPNGADWDLEAVLDDAINFAVANGRGGQGTPIFWAVSNGNYEVAKDEVCSHSSVIAVGRSTCNDTEDGSAFGPELDFLAPGVNVYSTQSGGGCGTGTGTSYAAPCAAGVGALVLAVKSDLTWQGVRQAIRDTCDKVGGVTYDANGHHDRYGFGRIDAHRCLSSLQGGVCFIATAAFGSPLEPRVEFLRSFRDEIVLKSRFKTLFKRILEGYYIFSPPIARRMEENRILKNTLKYGVVYPFIYIAKMTAYSVIRLEALRRTRTPRADPQKEKR